LIDYKEYTCYKEQQEDSCDDTNKPGASSVQRDLYILRPLLTTWRSRGKLLLHVDAQLLDYWLAMADKHKANRYTPGLLIFKASFKY
jgi:hypothetical protein